MIWYILELNNILIYLFILKFCYSLSYCCWDFSGIGF